MSNRGFFITPADRKLLIGEGKSAHLVFYCLCSHRNRETGEAWPKIPTIAKEIGVSRASVDRAILALKKATLITYKGLALGAVCRYQVGAHLVKGYAKRGKYYMPMDVFGALKLLKGKASFDVFLFMALRAYAKERRSIQITRAELANYL